MQNIISGLYISNATWNEQVLDLNARDQFSVRSDFPEYCRYIHAL